MYRKIANTFCKVLIYVIAFVVVALMVIMLIHILKESIPALREVGIKMFLPSSEWRPVSAAPQYGLLPAVTGTLYVSGLAVLFAMILGVACACFLTFFMPKKLASVCLAFIDLVAGIPSVIFGFIGLTVLVKAFAKYLKMAAGQCVLVAGIVLGIMLLPYIISTCQESLVNAKQTYEKSGLALGLSREYVLIKVILPAIRPGIVAVAPIMYTGAVMVADVPGKLTDPFMSLPYHLYMLVNNGFSLDYAYGTAFVLMLFLLVIQIICKCITYIRKDY